VAASRSGEEPLYERPLVGGANSRPDVYFLLANAARTCGCGHMPTTGCRVSGHTSTCLRMARVGRPPPPRAAVPDHF